MYTTKMLNDEIKAAIDARIHLGARIRPSALAIAIIHAHYAGIGETDGLMECCTFRHVRDQIGKHVASMRRTESSGRDQGELFSQLHDYYVVCRDGEDEAVPRMEMTTAERRHKADEIMKEGQAKIRHAREIQRETDMLIANGVLEPDVAAA